MTFSPAKSTLLGALLGLAALGTPAAKAEDTPAPSIAIELSAAEDIDGACRMSFLATNSGAADVDQAVYEVVLFGTNGGVAQLTLLDFRDLPAGRPRVRQFQFAGMACRDIPRVLINGAATCSGLPEGGCIDNLLLSTRTGTELIG